MTTHFEAIGTHWNIVVAPEPTNFDVVATFAAIRRRIEAFDKTYSRFRADSLVTQMSQSAGTYTLPEDAAPLVKLYRELYGLTDGAMTPLIGNALSAAGYDATYSFVESPMLSPPSWEEALQYTAPRLKVLQPVLLDFGAAGKGYLVDIVAKMLDEAHCLNYTVDAGGDIRYRGQLPLRIGLENPIDATQVIGVVTLDDGALCGSAGNRRAWGRFHHILDPHSLSSPQTPHAVWVQAETALLADALTTALMFVRPRQLTRYYSFEWLLLDASGALDRSAHFPAEVFLAT